MKNIFKKWKLYNSFKYTLIPKKSTYFKLSDKQKKKVNELYNTYGNMDYIYYYTSIGVGFKVKIWKRYEYIDLNE